MLPEVKNKDVTTDAHKIALESALETALSLSANQVHILDVTRGAPYEFGLQEFDTTVLKVKITSATANTDLTSAELNAIHDTIVGAQGKANKDEGLDLTASGYGYAEITSPTLTDGTSIPAPLDRGTVPQAQPSSGPKDLPAASTAFLARVSAARTRAVSRSPTGITSCPSSVRVSRASVWPSSWLS